MWPSIPLRGETPTTRYGGLHPPNHENQERLPSRMHQQILRRLQQGGGLMASLSRHFRTAAEVASKAAKEGHTILIAPVAAMFRGQYPCMVCNTKKQPKYSNRNLPSIGWFEGWTCPNCKARTSRCYSVADANYSTTCNTTGRHLVLWTVDSEGGDDS